MSLAKTPWSLGEGSDRECIRDADGNWIAEAIPGEPGEAEATARRIVACVNACAGIPTDEIEQQSRFDDGRAALAEVEQ